MQTLGNRIYDLHHLLDPINIEICSKVLKMSCFAESRERFDWDFVNDTGIINLLRKEYLSKGRIAPIFDLYQRTRIDGYSHRYESLIATNILAIVGNVVAGILLSVYAMSKDKVLEKLRRKNTLLGRELESAQVERILEQVKRGVLTTDSIEQYFLKMKEKMSEDLSTLTKCYVARRMVDDDVITRKEYDILTQYFLRRREGKKLADCLRRYKEFEKEYKASTNAILPEKVMLAVDGYSRGIINGVIEEGAEQTIELENELITYLYGHAASRGYGQGSLLKGGAGHIPQGSRYVLLLDARHFSPDDVNEIRESEAVVAYNSGMTGYLPLCCRALGKGCVLLKEEDASRLKEGTMVAVSGHQGIVAIGKMVI